MRVRVPFVGRPLPRVTWIKDGEVLEPSEKYDVSRDESNANLVINETEKSDKGCYTIQVENPLGRDQVCFNVTITGQLAGNSSQILW